jgi:predicted phage-related endonuclease
LEGVVAEWWADEHNTEVAEAPELYVANDVLIATLDRIVVGAPAAVEVKTTSMRVHEVSRHWWWQCQCQLACTGFERVHVAVLDGSLRLQSFIVTPDPEAMVRMVYEARTFLDRIEAGEDIAPEVPRTVDAIEIDRNTRELVRTLRLAQTAADAINADIGKLKGQISAHLGTHNVGTVDGIEVVRRQTRTVRNAIDAARFRREWPQLAAEYTREPATSTFIVVAK